jgi:protocatechuate 3,4-dioxygenase beta subunit
MKTGRISRRNFLYLGVGGGVAAAGYTLACAVTQSGDRKAGRKFKPTPSNKLGPFYREGAPVRERLTEPGEAGVPLLVAGRVFDTSGEQLPGAVIEVFHSDHYGDYDQRGFRHRGRIPVRARGDYWFETIMPGQYGGRAQHVHYVITAPGHKQLVTQLYFETDPKFEGDPDKNYARDNLVWHRELIRPVAKITRDNRAYSSVVFDICLEKA